MADLTRGFKRSALPASALAQRSVVLVAARSAIGGMVARFAAVLRTDQRSLLVVTWIVFGLIVTLNRPQDRDLQVQRNLRLPA